jgi:putative SbcD/Mre11-related phosphoesterase
MDEIEVFKGAYLSSQQCLYLRNEGMVVVADLHIGYESALEADGIHIPRVQTASIRDSLMSIVDRYNPETVMVLGDLKHEFSRNLNQELKDVRHILELLWSQVKVMLVKGNHDNYLENITSKMNIEVVESYQADGLTFVHGHNPCSERPLVMAHEHPSVKIVDRVGAYLKLPCFVHLQTERILVLPAFSPLASGTDLTGVSPSECLSPILREADISKGEVYACSDIGILPLGKLATLNGLRL